MIGTIRWIRAIRPSQRWQRPDPMQFLSKNHLAQLSKTLGSVGWAFTLLGLISGCAIGPDYLRPTLPESKTFGTTDPGSTGTAGALKGMTAQRFVEGAQVPPDWWTAFGSAELNRLVERAFLANPNIESAHAALRAAQENVSAQRGYFSRRFKRATPRREPSSLATRVEIRQACKAMARSSRPRRANLRAKGEQDLSMRPSFTTSTRHSSPLVSIRMSLGSTAVWWNPCRLARACSAFNSRPPTSHWRRTSLRPRFRTRCYDVNWQRPRISSRRVFERSLLCNASNRPDMPPSSMWPIKKLRLRKPTVTGAAAKAARPEPQPAACPLWFASGQRFPRDLFAGYPSIAAGIANGAAIAGHRATSRCARG